MTARIIDGKTISKRVLETLRDRIAKAKPVLAVVLVGTNPSSKVYVNMKELRCTEYGIESRVHRLSADTKESELLNQITALNEDDTVDGILVQMPLPKHIDEKRVVAHVDPRKDVDGFHPRSVAKLMLGRPSFIPCTPKGIIRILDEEGIEIAGKRAVVIGRSMVVGRPVAELLLQRNATVTICHSGTKDTAAITREADILISAVGQPGLVTKSMVREGADVIDVGTTRVADGTRKSGYRVVGDVVEAVREIASTITPVPGGVGPMTIAMLLENVLEAAERRRLQN